MQGRRNTTSMTAAMDEYDHVKHLPEEIGNTYNIVGYVVATFITISGGFFIYELIANSDWTFEAQWNIFKSSFGYLCFCIGFIMAIIWWGRFGHWSAKPVVETRDSWGNVIKRKENYDVIEQLFAKFLLPFLGHFFIEPLVYGCFIYYPIQCIIALVGTIFPYILSFIILGVIVLAWSFTHLFRFRYQLVALLLFGIIFSVGFAWGGYMIQPNIPEGFNTTFRNLPSDISEKTIDKDEEDEGFEDAIPQDEKRNQISDDMINEDEFE